MHTETKAKPYLLVLGPGYTGRRIAALAQARGWQVAATFRNPVHMPGITLYPFYALAESQPFTHILSSIPPGEKDPVWERYPALSAPWMGYLSTTGVYGDRGGEWVDESAGLRGDTPRLQRRIAAEWEWLSRGAHIFRLAGIYGPGRNALEDVRAGTARRIDKPGQVFSRVHVDDIAGAVLASMENPAPGQIYNVCDDVPAPAHEVVAHACRLLGMPVPPLVPFEQAVLSPMAREFYAANRRVSNRRLKKVLGYVLQYPDYRAGLAALLSGTAFANTGG